MGSKHENAVRICVCLFVAAVVSFALAAYQLVTGWGK
jgi:hypothetical protein